jgi:biopolymer transport protein ExbD
MTPMVDIVMLLLIFYMVTTVFSMPQAMEINLPPVDRMNDTIVVRYNNLLILRVDQDDHLLWSNWNHIDSLPKLIPSHNPDKYAADTDSLRRIMQTLHHYRPDLNTLILIHPEASYSLMVDILDEIDCYERYANYRLSQRFGVTPESLPDSLRFSYRYALGDWGIVDDNIAAETLVGIN